MKEKILRFNLEEDSDPAQSGVSYNRWIPNDNPFNAELGVQSAVWSTGIRNNQGFAYNPITGKLYGSSHGPHSDDEINIIERAKNYGHPVVIGFAADENYMNSGAGKPSSSLPVITSEVANKDTIGPSYQDPIHTAYASDQAEINYIYNGNVSNNGLWPSEGWSGLDIDTSTVIPGAKNSLLAASLKWGRVMRLKLSEDGSSIINIDGTSDTASYFGSRNRFRDLAVAPDGRSWFVVIDRSETTSGPTSANPIVPACGGCVQKYTFLGYKRSMAPGANEKSTIPTTIPVAMGTPNTIHHTRTFAINSASMNDTVWVPFNGPDGNIVAEVKAKMNGTTANNLGNVSVSYYRHSGPVREDAQKKLYLNRNITINFQNTPTQPMSVRLYFTKAELDALIPALNSAGTGSGITDISTMVVRQHNGAIGASLTGETVAITPVIREEFGANQSYVLQLLLEPPFSNQYSFFLGNPNSTLPVNLLNFKGSYQDAGNVLLQWSTINEENSREFEIQRGVDGTNFTAIGTLSTRGSGANKTDYTHRDLNIADQAGNTLYYRLRIIDNDGKFKYSNTITVNIPFEPGKVVVMPNPVVGSAPVKAYITSSVNTRVKWSIVDNSGRAVLESSMTVRPGSNTLDINASGLNAGIYYLVVRGEGIDQRVRIQKL
ncbi:MAG: PQQ-dependent sugar dehydrogenase [Chitinophagaceae bacterium]|nr:PQQ-dependent sugar dehydrogenase [Chitinophagaceae bacterium]